MIVWDAMTDPATLAQETWEWDGARFRRSSYGEVLADARRAGAALRKRGVGPGSVVAGVLTNGPDTSRAALGVMFTGATFASLPIIARGMTVTAYLAQLSGLCGHLHANCLLVEERFLAFMPEGADLGVDLVGYRSLLEGVDMADVEPPALDEVLYIQFSSGTTGDPRGAQLTGAAIEAQLIALAERLSIDPNHDVGYMWLPQSHDMGIFGGPFLAAYTGMRAVRSTPERFLQSPRSWFDDCARFGVTLTAGPPAALDMAARAERVGSSRGASGGALNLRLCLVGAEMVEWPVLERAASAFAARGLSIETFTTAYGLAEATLAVTVGDLDRAPGFVDVDREALALGTLSEVEAGDPRGRRLVSAGQPLPDADVRIDPVTGEIVIRSNSLACGYFDNARATRAHFQADAFRTSDLGFLRDGHLYVYGRSDDVVILNGRNVFVHGLEAALGETPGIREGSCALVQETGHGRRRISFVAEFDDPRVDPDELALRVRRMTMEAEGLPVDECVFLPAGAFPMTPSGKVQRYRCREIVRRAQVGVRVANAAPQVPARQGDRLQS
jgi:fatty-acyl-CoA synthase